jgi:NAD(P)-dependent dehydrogenase (short-subunit alcohol dehydrogenase family)
MSLRLFADSTVLVTGAGRGIGKRLALGFAAAGARVGLLARSLAEVNAAQLEIEHANGKAIALPADVRNREQVQAAAEILTSAFGDISILVAAAAVQGPIGPFATSDAARWQVTFDTNVLGVMYSIQAVLPAMIQHRSGKIIVVTGGGAGTPRPNFAPYAASKAALVRLVESVAGEVDAHNVQINSFGPGGSYTCMTDEILQAGALAGESEKQDAEQVRQTGGVSAERQIAAALFLASSRSNHINGKMIHVNDDLKRLESGSLKPDTYTLRRLKI